MNDAMVAVRARSSVSSVSQLGDSELATREGTLRPIATTRSVKSYLPRRYGVPSRFALESG